MHTSCQILDAKKNRLQDCPEAIGSLSRLKRLELDGELGTSSAVEKNRPAQNVEAIDN